jgi:hypothetical protein
MVVVNSLNIWQWGPLLSCVKTSWNHWKCAHNEPKLTPYPSPQPRIALHVRGKIGTCIHWNMLQHHKTLKDTQCTYLHLHIDKIDKSQANTNAISISMACSEQGLLYFQFCDIKILANFSNFFFKKNSNLR